MAKRKAAKKGRKTRTPSPRARDVDPMADPSPNNAISSDELVSQIKGLATGWDKDMEKALALPKHLHFQSLAENRRAYSKEGGFGVNKTLGEIRMGVLYAPETEYGISIYETAGHVNFFMIDMKRRIIVHTDIVCYSNSPPQRDWSVVKEAIEAAEKKAAEDKDSIAVHNMGFLDLRKPTESSKP